MPTCTLAAPAKINLYLEVVGDRPDGFHELVMVMQSVALADGITVTFEPSDPPGTTAPSPDHPNPEHRSITLHCDHPEVPTDATNLAHRAAALLWGQWSYYCGDRPVPQGHVTLTITKNIPVGAGLAGGSTNAAAVLVGLNHLWDMGLAVSEIEHLCAKLGSDIPFCVQGGTVLALGRGEVLESMAPAGPLALVLAKYRSLSVSTPWAYGSYRQQFAATYVQGSAEVMVHQEAVRSGPLAAAIATGEPSQICQHLHNDLEKVVLPAHPNVAALRDAFAAQPEVIGTLMSGSGPTVFAVCDSPAAAETVRQAVADRLQDPDLDLWVTHALPHGVTLQTPEGNG
ncbi:MAG: 4-(cytidine 5'-diphospho)-2-C-methyl-D-erythritol kinase [Prochlorothrix sp.]